LQKDLIIPDSLKVIACTAYDSPEDKLKWQQVGMRGFINKPVSIDMIVKTLKS
jgi:CheY-like chemotaxis protein